METSFTKRVNITVLLLSF